MQSLAYPFFFFRYYRRWMAEESLDPDRMGRLQEKKLDCILGAAKRTKHYAGILPAGLDGPGFMADSRCVPITEKKDLRDATESFVPEGIDVKKLGFAQTSGSTGFPTRIYLDMDTACYRQAVRYATDVSFGRTPFELFARIHAHDYDRSSLMGTRFFFPKIFLPIFNRPEENFRLLQKHRPSMLRGYPSSIFLLSRMNEVAGRPLKFKAVVCVSELLSDDTRKAIGDSFSCPVYTQYGSMESSSVARECVEERRLHVESHSCIVEITDPEGNPKKSGEGEMILTPLFNRAMPILRFRVGDRAAWGGECGCGRPTPTIKNLSGRVDDYILLPSGRLRPGKNFYLELSLLSHFYEYQIVQEAPDLIVFRYVPIRDLPGDAERAIRDHILGQCLGERMRVEFERVGKVKRGATGKLRVVSSKVPIDSADARI